VFDPIMIKNIDDIRTERNKIHLNNINPTSDGEKDHEYFRVVSIRRNLDIFIDNVKKILDNF